MKRFKQPKSYNFILNEFFNKKGPFFVIRLNKLQKKKRKIIYK